MKNLVPISHRMFTRPLYCNDQQRTAVTSENVSPMTTNSQTSQQTTPLPPPRRIVLTVAQLAERQPGLSVGSIRWDLFNRTTNGLAESGALMMRGRRILIDPDKYLEWMSNNAEAM